ncbi:hypothetical protein ACYSNU_00385 [Enterococcus sp. LJL120]
MNNNRKKNYYVSEEFIAKVKEFAWLDKTSEGKILEKMLAHYSGEDELIRKLDTVLSEVRIQKKIGTSIEKLCGVSQIMLASIAEIQGVYVVVESGQGVLFKDAEKAYDVEKNAKIIASRNNWHYK